LLNLDTSGLVLAGGAGRRMGGKDKGLIEFKNKPLILYSIENLKLQVLNIFISANRSFEAYQKFNYPILRDLSVNKLGPLAGIQTGLFNCKSKYLMVVSCDTPNLPNNLLEKLFDSLKLNNSDIAIPFTVSNDDEKQIHPTTMLLSTSLLKSLDNFLNKGGRKIDLWTKEHKVTEVFFEDEKNFLNLNTMNDLLNFE
jgi:molybdenum cofactor guanylyltransferase